MQLTVHYAKRYDCTYESYNRQSTSTEHVGSGSVAWDGVSDIVALISQVEHEFLTVDHPKNAPFSWDHRNYRIEVTGLTIGGQNGLALKLASEIKIPAVVPKEAVAT